MCGWDIVYFRNMECKCLGFGLSSSEADTVPYTALRELWFYE